MSEESVFAGVSARLLEHLREQICPVPLGAPEDLKLTFPGAQEDFRLGLCLYDFEELSSAGPPQMVRLSREERRFPDLRLSLRFLIFANRKAAFRSMEAGDEILLLEAALRAVHSAPELEYGEGTLKLLLQPPEGRDKAALWQSLSCPMQPAVYLSVEPVELPSARILRVPAVREVDVKTRRKGGDGG